METRRIARILQEAGYSCLEERTSALARYRGGKAPRLFLASDAPLAELARLFPALEFPGLPGEDALLALEAQDCVFHVVEAGRMHRPPFTVLALQYDPLREVFVDREGVYPDLRKERLVSFPDPQEPLVPLLEAARLAAAFAYAPPTADFAIACRDEVARIRLPENALRALLIDILSGNHADRALALLAESGFVEKNWPELACLDAVPHDKDFHPEGNVWEHTLATLRYRKHPDPLLSLALLVHDIGKAAASGDRERPFDNHSQLGATAAARFLRRLGFTPATVDDIVFLVRHHMLVEALPRLPESRVRGVLENPLFPTLLELFRADLSAAGGDEGTYYEACRRYRRHLKDRTNPWRHVVRCGTGMRA